MAVTTSPEEVLDFWLNETGPKGWYQSSDELDETIRSRFIEAWEQAKAGKLDSWECSPSGALALLILLDQFPRNMFRGDGRSFATDAKALALNRGRTNRRPPTSKIGCSPRKRAFE